MSTLKVDNIQSYAGGDVTLNGNLDVTGIISGDGSGLTNVPGGGGSDLSSYTGSINQTGGTVTFDGDVNANQGIRLPYDGSVKNMIVGLSGSLNYSVGGFDFGGKTYGQIYSNADGGFKIADAAPGDTFPNITLQSDNGTIQLRTQTTGSAGSIINTIEGNGSFRAINVNTVFSAYGGGTSVGIGVQNRGGGTGAPFGGNLDSTYGLNLYNTVNYNQDTGLALDMSAVGSSINKIGIYSNYGAAYEAVMSWEDANNYTDGALQVHQILKVDGTNTQPAETLNVKDGAGTPRLIVNNAAIKAFVGNVDVIVNGVLQVDDTITLPNIGNYANDGDAATGGVPLRGVYHHNGDLKIRLT